MKSISSRDRALIMALPAILFFLIYYFFVAKGAKEQTGKLEQERRVLTRNSKDLQRASRARKNLQNVQSLINEKKSLLSGEVVQNSISGFGDNTARARGSEAVSGLLVDNNIVLVAEVKANEKDQERFLPLLKALPSAELWHLRLACDFEAMSKTVAALADLKLPVVPVAVEMEQKVEGNKSIHLWNLWICR